MHISKSVLRKVLKYGVTCTVIKHVFMFGPDFYTIAAPQIFSRIPVKVASFRNERELNAFLRSSHILHKFE